MIDPHGHRDIVGEEYWTSNWSGEYERTAVDERDSSWRNYVTRRFDRLFDAQLARAGSRPADLTEVGCARSRWLPYFARRFGLSVRGLDYSKIGCRQAEEILRAAGVPGEIHHGNLFSPPAPLVGRADIVLSWGLVEHFTDTRAVAQALHRLSKPGGLVFTVIPNMNGSVGWLQKKLNRRIYDLHVPLDREQLREGFSGAGGEVVFCDYFLCCNYWTVNLGEAAPRKPPHIPKRVAHKVLALSTLLLWQAERLLGIAFPASRLFSPYVVCVSRTAAS